MRKKKRTNVDPARDRPQPVSPGVAETRPLGIAGPQPEPTKPLPAVLSMDQAWELLGGKAVITKQALYLAAKRGEFPTVRIGKRVLIPRVPFENHIKGLSAKIA